MFTTYPVRECVAIHDTTELMKEVRMWDQACSHLQAWPAFTFTGTWYEGEGMPLPCGATRSSVN